MTDSIFNDPQSLNTHIRPTWCPGCGNFSIWMAIKNAMVKLGAPHEEVVLVYDVGCSGNMTDFVRGYGFHSLHGRAIPPGVGMKLANEKLKVLIIIGDGGGYGEGLTHLMNEMRGNHDVTVLVHNNHRYSLTTGQMSPATPKGTKTRSTPEGSIEEEINPIAIALSNHATFVARGFAVQVPQLTQLIVDAVAHEGFSLIDVLQPCMVFNPEMDAKWYMEHMIDIGTLGHDATNRMQAIAEAHRTDKIPIGLFWQDAASVPYHKQDAVLARGPLVARSGQQIDISPLLKQFA